MSDKMLQFLGQAFGTDHPAYQAHPNIKNKESIKDVNNRFKQGEFNKLQTRGALVSDVAILVSAGVTDDALPEEVIALLKKERPEIFVAAAAKAQKVIKENIDWNFKQAQEHQKVSTGLLLFSKKFGEAKTIQEMEEAHQILQKLLEETKSKDLKQVIEKKIAAMPDKDTQIKMIFVSEIGDILKLYKEKPGEESAKEAIAKLEKIKKEIENHNSDSKLINDLGKLINGFKESFKAS